MADELARQVRGEGLGKVLADFLNRLDQRNQRLRKRGVRVKKHRVVRLLEDLATLKQVPAMPAGSERQALADKLQHRLNRQLKAYAEYSQLFLIQDGRYVVEFESKHKVLASERMAVSAMCRLLRDGLLERERRCLRCRRWYFAKKEDSKYCTRRCQTTTTEEAKEKKRAYMKSYYQLKKSGKVRLTTKEKGR